MPPQTYEITAPNGKVLEITGDHVPTETELRQIFTQAGVDTAPIRPVAADGPLQRGLTEFYHKSPIGPLVALGQGTARVIAPPPLGRMGKKLAEIYAMPVAQRPLDLYAALAEVAR